MPVLETLIHAVDDFEEGRYGAGAASFRSGGPVSVRVRPGDQRAFRPGDPVSIRTRHQPASPFPPREDPVYSSAEIPRLRRAIADAASILSWGLERPSRLEQHVVAVDAPGSLERVRRAARDAAAVLLRGLEVEVQGDGGGREGGGGENTATTYRSVAVPREGLEPDIPFEEELRSALMSYSPETPTVSASGTTAGSENDDRTRGGASYITPEYGAAPLDSLGLRSPDRVRRTPADAAFDSAWLPSWTMQPIHVGPRDRGASILRGEIDIDALERAMRAGVEAASSLSGGLGRAEGERGRAEPLESLPITTAEWNHAADAVRVVGGGGERSSQASFTPNSPENEPQATEQAADEDNTGGAADQGRSEGRSSASTFWPGSTEWGSDSSEGEDLPFVLSTEYVEDGDGFVDFENYNERQRILWEPATRSASDEAAGLQEPSDMGFTPQTPTHAPVMPAHLSRGALLADNLIPALHLAAARARIPQSGHEHPETGTVQNRGLERPPREITIVPGGRGGEHLEYLRDSNVSVELGPNGSAPGPNDRLNLQLPNPDNLPTYQLNLTVPYQTNRVWPLEMNIIMPPRENPQSNDTALLRFHVHQTHSAENLEPSEAEHEHSVERERSEAARFVRELPRVNLSDLTEPADRQCPVCHQAFTPAPQEIAEGEEQRHDTAVRLPCNHIIGCVCLLRWFFGEPGSEGSARCPMCRRWQPFREQVPVTLPRPLAIVGENLVPRPLAAIEEEDTRRTLDEMAHPEDHDTLFPDQSSWDHMRHRDRASGRDAALAIELIPWRERVQIASYEEEQRMLFERIQAGGYFQPTYIPERYRGEMTDAELYAVLRERGVHLYPRFGMFLPLQLHSSVLVSFLRTICCGMYHALCLSHGNIRDLG